MSDEPVRVRVEFEGVLSPPMPGHDAFAKSVPAMWRSRYCRVILPDLPGGLASVILPAELVHIIEEDE